MRPVGRSRLLGAANETRVLEKHVVNIEVVEVDAGVVAAAAEFDEHSGTHAPVARAPWHFATVGRQFEPLDPDMTAVDEVDRAGQSARIDGRPAPGFAVGIAGDDDRLAGTACDISQVEFFAERMPGRKQYPVAGFEPRRVDLAERSPGDFPARARIAVRAALRVYVVVRRQHMAGHEREKQQTGPGFHRPATGCSVKP